MLRLVAKKTPLKIQDRIVGLMREKSLDQTRMAKVSRKMMVVPKYVPNMKMQPSLEAFLRDN